MVRGGASRGGGGWTTLPPGLASSVFVSSVAGPAATSPIPAPFLLFLLLPFSAALSISPVVVVSVVSVAPAVVVVVAAVVAVGAVGGGSLVRLLSRRREVHCCSGVGRGRTRKNRNDSK